MINHTEALFAADVSEGSKRDPDETRLVKAAVLASFRTMTLLQIQRKVKALSRSERLALSAYLRHLSRAESESNKRSLDAAAGRMAKGEKVTRTQLQRLHRSLRAAGV